MAQQRRRDATATTTCVLRRCLFSEPASFGPRCQLQLQEEEQQQQAGLGPGGLESIIYFLLLGAVAAQKQQQQHRQRLRQQQQQQGRALIYHGTTTTTTITTTTSLCRIFWDRRRRSALCSLTDDATSPLSCSLRLLRETRDVPREQGQNLAESSLKFAGSRTNRH